jgi:hypothetical protein
MSLALLGWSRPPTGEGPDLYGACQYRHYVIGGIGRVVGFGKMSARCEWHAG